MSATPIRALLVDDEVLARLAVRQALATHPHVQIVGECGNASEAMQAITALRPDLLFLDIQMPGMDGFALLRALDAGTAPQVIFTTAYSEHALRAFDAHAVDYLLKPIDQARFDQAMVKVIERRRPDPQAAAELRQPYLQRISVRVGEHIRVLRVDDIDWIRADGNYVHIHAAGNAWLHRESLAYLEAALDPQRFLRIHRGTLVNMDRVQEIHPLFRGGSEVILRDGTRLRLSRRFRERAMQALGQH